MFSSVVRIIAHLVFIHSLVMAHIQRLDMVDRLVLFAIVVCSLVKTIILVIMFGLMKGGFIVGDLMKRDHFMVRYHLVMSGRSHMSEL